MRLGGKAAVGAAGVAVVGLGNGPTAAGAAGRSDDGAGQGIVTSARSGVVSMASARHTVRVSGGLTAKSRVLATINSDPDRLGCFPVVAATPDPATGTIKLQTNFSGLPPYPEVTWFVFD